MLWKSGDPFPVFLFEELEALLYPGKVKSTGTILMNTQKINPVPVYAGKAVYPSDEEIDEALSRTSKHVYKVPAIDLGPVIENFKCLNIVLLGAVSVLFDDIAPKYGKMF